MKIIVIIATIIVLYVYVKFPIPKRIIARKT